MKKILLIFVICNLALLSTLAAIPNVTQNLPVCQPGGSFYYLPPYNLWLPGYGSNFSGSKAIPPFWGDREGLSDSIFTWQYYQFPFPYGFTDVFFIDSLYGWATYTGNGVARTTNSGFNWDTTSFGPSNYMGGVHFVDRNTGWAVGGMGRIRKTTNGGVNWIIQDHEMFAGYYRKVHFFDQNSGVVIGEKNGPFAYVIRTTNSGDNWMELLVSTTYATSLWDQYWLNSNTGWFCGSNILLKTTNGGLDFINYYSNIPPTQNGSNLLYGISFINDNTGWIAASNIDRKNIYKTTNGGLNWFFQDNPVAQYEFSSASHVKFLSPDTGWAAVYYLGVILATTNGGDNWVIDNMANSEFYRFTIYGKSKVWCAAYPGQIWYAVISGPNGGLKQGEIIPSQFNLLQNYPNPFNSTTIISFEVPYSSYVQIKIYNLLGEELETVVNGVVNAGHHEIKYNASKLSSGIYLYNLKYEDKILTKKLVLVK